MAVCCGEFRAETACPRGEPRPACAARTGASHAPHLKMMGNSMTQAMNESASKASQAVAARQGESISAELISFAIGEEQYGVDIMAVREIKGWSEISHLPGQPDYVRGVLNLRGVMVPIIDLRCRFGGGLTEATALHVVIIVQIGDQQIGLLADRVLDIVAFEGEQVQPVPSVVRNGRTEFLSGLITIEGGMIAMIDLGHLLDDRFEAQAA
jgi:purine-binding chemotaxis protein CheW